MVHQVYSGKPCPVALFTIVNYGNNALIPVPAAVPDADQPFIYHLFLQVGYFETCQGDIAGIYPGIFIDGFCGMEYPVNLPVS